MKKETDLASVKSIAIALLYLDIELTPMSPMIVTHPFFEGGISVIRNEQGEFEPVNLLENPEALEAKRQEIKEDIEKSDNLWHIYNLIRKPYVFAFLKFAGQYLSKDDLSEMLGDAWVSVEVANNDANMTKAQLVALFKKCNPDKLMDKEELKSLKKFRGKEKLTVYRGVTPYNEKNLKALSWTVSKNKAEWFAKRFSEKGKVYQAEIPTGSILAYFEKRNESEVVLDPSKLENIRVIKDFSK